MIRDAYLETAAEARALIATRDVARRWDEPSALRLMSVGALAGHLTRAISQVEPYLDSTPSDATGAVLTADQYFTKGAALTNDIDDPLNTSIRARGATMAADGHGALVSLVDTALDSIRARLAREPDDRMIAAFAGTFMQLDEYLVTRLVEMSVHIDDLAVSVDRPTPDLPAVAYMCAIGSLLQMARGRHGDLAVLRAMARRERDSVDALRVL